LVRNFQLAASADEWVPITLASWKTELFDVESGCGQAVDSYLIAVGVAAIRAETGQFAVWWRQNPVFMMISAQMCRMCRLQ
jgi:hypothetical protein